MRRQGLRAILWSGGGGIAGSVIGAAIGAAVFQNSFAHTVTTDVGFLLGLGVALLLAINPRGRRLT